MPIRDISRGKYGLCQLYGKEGRRGIKFCLKQSADIVDSDSPTNIMPYG